MAGTMATSQARRLLLLEFVSHERWVYNSRYFPFIKGGAEALGISSQWVCFGAEIKVEKTGHNRVAQYVDLAEGDLRTLAKLVNEQGPTHVVVSHPVSEAVRAVLRTAGPGLAVMSTSDHAPAPGETNLWSYVGALLEQQRRAGLSLQRAPTGHRLADDPLSWMHGRTDWLLRWLGETPDRCAAFDKYMVGAFTPSYDALMANDKARAFRPHLLIVGGVACDHFKKVKEHPAYADLDLSECAHDYGCSYCTWFRGATSDLHRSPLETARVQLDRVLQTAGSHGRYCGVVDLLDVRIFSQVDRFVDMVVAMGMPPTKFCFEPRVDRLLQLRGKLERALQKCAGAGHSLCLFRMGTENMVEDENLLFNKHVNLAQIDEGVRLLATLSDKYGSAFEYDPRWGYITCSPWTTLEMLETGFSRAIERGFEPKGVWLYTPLLLFRSAPITRLAEQQGLVAEAFDDPSMLYEPSVNDASFDSFVPWRFKDERTATAFALIVRFCAAALRDKYPDSVFEGDALYGRMLSLGDAAGGFDRPDLFARQVMKAIRDGSVGLDRFRLVEEAVDRYRVVMDALGPAARQPEAQGGVPPVRAAYARRMLRVLQAVQQRLSARLGDLRVVGVSAGRDDELLLSVSAGSNEYELRLTGAAPDKPYLIRTKQFCLTHSRQTPVTNAHHLAALKLLVESAGMAIARHAPEMLSGAGGRDER